MKSVYLKTVLMGFIVGIAIFNFVPVVTLFWSLVLFVMCVSLAFGLKKYQKISLVFCFLACVFLANGRVILDQHKTTSASIDFYNDVKNSTVFQGWICDEPDLRAEKGKYTICVEKLENGQKISGKVLVTVARYPDFSYGSKLKITGKLQTPAEFEDFSYRNYLSRYEIFSVSYYPEIVSLEKGEGSIFYRKIYAWKKALENKISRIFPEPNASFLAGLLIGARRGIPETVMEDFNLTGLTHIIAISGYNITIVIVFILGILKFLPRKISFYFAVVAVSFFVIFVGASSAVVRAGIMGILGLVALNQGRQKSVTILILVTASAMIAYNPKILWYDVGFQLSFLAILGLVYIAPFFENRFAKIPQTLGLREALMLTLSAQITAVPLILLNFERLSLIAPLANILVAPFIPLAMLFGFLAILVSFLSFKLSLLVGFVAYIFLEIILKTAEFLAQIPWASVEIENVSVGLVVGYYVALLLVIYKNTHRQNF